MPVKNNLQQIWEQLRSQNAARKDNLLSVRLQNIHGIRDLQVAFPFPVCVLAGANSCGKSTILSALACAYEDSDAKYQHSPQKRFPEFRPKDIPELADSLGNIGMTFAYNVTGQSMEMQWKRGSSKWNKSFSGRKGAAQPKRKVYFHTLSRFSNPSEKQSVQQLAQRKYEPKVIDASNIAFAQRILGTEYAKLTRTTRAGQDVLVVEKVLDGESNCQYSEYHMSSGERAVIWLSIHLSKLENALVLIDEIDTGLHPYIQQMLMLELQRLALRNNLQIVCTTHSSVVLDTVPNDARIFLERESDNVVRKEAWRDTIQKSLYGHAHDALTFLCEDEEAESLIRGIFDFLGPKLDLLQNDIDVGHDTGKDQFLAHMETLRHFRKLNDVVFVLDGDGKEVKQEMEKRAATNLQQVNVLKLPGDQIPEIWAWNLLEKSSGKYASFFGCDEAVLKKQMTQLDAVFDNAADKPANIAKHKLYDLVDKASKSTSELFREMGKREAESFSGDVHELATALEDAVRQWRALR